MAGRWGTVVCVLLAQATPGKEHLDVSCTLCWNSQEAGRADAGEGPDAIHTQTAVLTPAVLTIINIFFAILSSETIGALTEIGKTAAGEVKICVANVYARSVVCALVPVTFINVDLTVPSVVAGFTDTGVVLGSVTEAGAVVDAGLEVARVVWDGTDRSTPAGGTMALEAHGQGNAAGLVLTGQGETVIDTQLFKCPESLRVGETHTVID